MLLLSNKLLLTVAVNIEKSYKLTDNVFATVNSY